MLRFTVPPDSVRETFFRFLCALSIVGLAAASEADVPDPSARPSGKPPPTSTRQGKFLPLIPTGDESPPVCAIDRPRYNFGTVYRGEEVKHRFEVENRGGLPLIIRKIF